MKRTIPIPEPGDSLPTGVEWIYDPADTRVSDYFGLTDVALRRRLEPEQGLYMAESEKVIARALAAGHQMRSLLVTPRWLVDLRPRIDEAIAAGTPVYVAAPDVVESMTGFHLHRGALAAMHRPIDPVLEETIQGARTIAVLEDIVDHTNVGAIFRSAAALGVEAILVTPRCADPLYRRAVRVSMGTVFQVPWTRLTSWPDGVGGVAALREQGFQVAAMALGSESVALDDLERNRPERLAVILGTEGDGLSEQTVAHADFSVQIPMAAEVDSLNVAAASAVTFWALRSASQAAQQG